MKLEKNWFYYVSVALGIIGLLYIIVCGFISLGSGQEYPYLPKGLLLIGIFALWIIIWLSAALGARFRWEKYLSVNKAWVKYGEMLFVAVVLLAAVAVRVITIKAIPMKPASDYKTYFEIAELLKEGNIQKYGKGYCNYIAMFPHVMGYCYILTLLFKVTGVSVLAGQYLNIAFAVATVFLVYKIARRIGGRIAGLTALILCAFWPSQVLYCTMLSAECSFTFFFYLCVWLFISLVLDYDGYTKKSGQAIALHLLLGVLIAITAAIRPMALILMIAMVLTILPHKMKLPPVPINDIPLTLRFLEKGWVRCVMILIPYMIVSGIITTNIELTVDRTLPSGSASFGYNLLVGLNTESKGGWNDEDADLLYGSMEETGSATQAHITCRDLAFQRLFGNPEGVLNLFIEKYELLWGNDDYGATWNLAFLEEQGNLTPQLNDFLYQVRDLNDIMYIITVFFAVIGLIYIWRGKASIASLLSLIYLGTVAMHLMVESQNRYHYFVLQIFMIFAGMAVQFMFTDERRKKKAVFLEERRLQKEKQMEALNLLTMEQEEEEVSRLRQEALANVFNMQNALEKGHIVMTVTEAYDGGGNSEDKEEPRPGKAEEKKARPEEEKEPEEKRKARPEEEEITVSGEYGLEGSKPKGTDGNKEQIRSIMAENDWSADVDWPEDDWSADVDWSKDDWSADVDWSGDDIRKWADE